MERYPQDREDLPGQFPDETPRAPQNDYSFTLQAIMELQKTVGGLVQSIDDLKKNVDDQKKVISQVRLTLAFAGGAALIIGYVVKLVWDKLDIILHAAKSFSS